MDKCYILDGKMAVQCPSILEWCVWMETNTRQVALDVLDGITVSTVFLGLDHNFGNGDPLLFETMVFLADGKARECWRYFTWAEAEAGHQEIVKAIEEEIAQSHTVTGDVIRELAANK